MWAHEPPGQPGQGGDEQVLEPVGHGGGEDRRGEREQHQRRQERDRSHDQELHDPLPPGQGQVAEAVQQEEHPRRGCGRHDQPRDGIPEDGQQPGGDEEHGDDER